VYWALYLYEDFFIQPNTCTEINIKKCSYSLSHLICSVPASGSVLGLVTQCSHIHTITMWSSIHRCRADYRHLSLIGKKILIAVWLINGSYKIKLLIIQSSQFKSLDNVSKIFWLQISSSHYCSRFSIDFLSSQDSRVINRNELFYCTIVPENLIPVVLVLIKIILMC